MDSPLDKEILWTMGGRLFQHVKKVGGGVGENGEDGKEVVPSRLQLQCSFQGLIFG
jgi:hypothetical protein